GSPPIERAEPSPGSTSSNVVLVILRQLGDIRRDPSCLIARELCGALRDGALRTHGAIGWEQFAAGGLTRIEADTVSSWDYSCRKSRPEQLRSLRLQC